MWYCTNTLTPENVEIILIWVDLSRFTVHDSPFEYESIGRNDTV